MILSLGLRVNRLLTVVSFHSRRGPLYHFLLAWTAGCGAVLRPLDRSRPPPIGRSAYRPCGRGSAQKGIGSRCDTWLLACGSKVLDLLLLPDFRPAGRRQQKKESTVLPKA